MIINKKTCEFTTRNDMPNENWLNDEDYVVIPDGSELANIVLTNYPYIKLIIENDVLVNVEIDTNAKIQAEQQLNVETQIEELKQKLTDTDYQAIKYAEGQLSEEEYAPIREQRQAWRDRINELESGLAEVKEVVPAEETTEVTENETVIEEA